MMTNDEIEQRLNDGSDRFTILEDHVSQILAALSVLPKMQQDIEEAKKDSKTVKEIVEAWNAVKVGGKFVKWVGPIVGAFFAGWATIKFEVASMLGIVK